MKPYLATCSTDFRETRLASCRTSPNVGQRGTGDDYFYNASPVQPTNTVLLSFDPSL
jgi:hypothetical protein